ncbi:endonuclease III-like protein 1 isoform X2 [Drosophila bipectinata]|uniref:endonuclease III-like protein 1 isoform X2 n=1 Tax=Drosophila bipectinata TaxID=42026 RepID=UPI0038B38383
MAKNVKKLSLANKLAKKGDVITPTKIIIRQNSAHNDIEDLVQASSSTSLYFSPVASRKQRNLNGEPHKIINIKSEPISPTRVPPKIKKEEPLSRIAVGSAVVVKCKVIPDIVDSPIRINQIKKENDPLIKQEIIQEMVEKIKKEMEPRVEPQVNPEVDAPNPLWNQHLVNIRTMRNSMTAPVDTMGCHKCADTNADAKTQRFQNLVALMLSSQTKDQTTFEAMIRLKDRNLCPQTLKDMPVEDLEGLLYPVSFYKNKAKYLKQTVQILIDKYDSDIPDNPKELKALPGVGPKMAHICMAVAWNKVTGIGVDVHVHRLSNRLKWVARPTKEPEQTRVALEKWLPHSLWSEVNHLFVGFGQTICTPVKPNCRECLNKDICPSANLETQPKKKSDR